MLVSDVRKRVKEIKEAAEKDSEGAHAKEDRLYRDVLVHIAGGGAWASGQGGVELAREALKTQQYGITRTFG